MAHTVSMTRQVKYMTNTHSKHETAGGIHDMRGRDIESDNKMRGAKN